MAMWTSDAFLDEYFWRSVDFIFLKVASLF